MRRIFTSCECVVIIKKLLNDKNNIFTEIIRFINRMTIKLHQYLLKVRTKNHKIYTEQFKKKFSKLIDLAIKKIFIITITTYKVKLIPI